MGQFSQPENNPRKSRLMVRDTCLGEMWFCDEDETWVGSYNGFECRIAGDKTNQPEPELLSYCQMFLADPDGLNQELVKQKKYKQGCHNGCFDDEITGLHFMNLMFYRRRESLRVLAQLCPDIQAGGLGCSEFLDNSETERLWRMEFYDGQCQGLDFDY